MQAPGRIQAAIDLLGEIAERHRPAAIALADWGKSHRFAGAGDRSAIGNFVYDALRNRASAAHHMGSGTARGIMLGTLATMRGLSADEIAVIFDGSRHAPAALKPDELERLKAGPPSPPADWQKANVPEWLWPDFSAVFGAHAVAEGEALARRAPVDLRANTLRATREQLMAAFADHAEYHAAAAPFAPNAIRIPAPEGDKRTPNVEADVAHGKGWFEVQDEGSQIAAHLAGAKPGERVLDLCAGAGGKTLALAASMANDGRIDAYDADKTRLRPIFERLTRAGVTNVEVVPSTKGNAIAALGPDYDLVLIDAPCSGTGVWRRRPDTKWRLKADQIAVRIREQAAVLALAAPRVKPGGRLVYVTCSLLAAENTGQIAAFQKLNPAFEIVPWRTAWQQGAGATAIEVPNIQSADGRDDSLLLTPARHGTDGFFVTVMTRRV